MAATKQREKEKRTEGLPPTQEHTPVVRPHHFKVPPSSLAVQLGVQALTRRLWETLTQAQHQRACERRSEPRLQGDADSKEEVPLYTHRVVRPRADTTKGRQGLGCGVQLCCWHAARWHKALEGYSADPYTLSSLIVRSRMFTCWYLCLSTQKPTDDACLNYGQLATLEAARVYFSRQILSNQFKRSCTIKP